MPKQVDRILDSIRRSKGVNSRDSAIRIAKSQGLVKQKGKHLALTDKGRKSG